MTNTIKLQSEILADLTPTSPQWEKNAAYNQLLRLRDNRDYFTPIMAQYEATGDRQGIYNTRRALNSLNARISEAESKLIECGVIKGQATAPVIRTMPELESDIDAHRVNRFANLTAQAIEAGNASDAGSFARSLAHDALTVGA